MKILLVEDDEILVASLAADLTAQNYVVEAVNDGNTGLSYAQATEYDLIVLDVDLPGMDGITLCQRLRQDHYEGPILLLTAKGDSDYKVQGLDAGADDYVVKPCPTDELTARIRALLRRPREITSSVLQWGALQLDPSTCQVFFAEANISLSPKEYGILELFLRNPQRVFSSTVLLERLWGFDEMPGEETIRSHIKRLRRKLKNAGADEVIENIYGMGYRLMPAPLASTMAPTSAIEKTPDSTLTPTEPKPSPAARAESAAAATADVTAAQAARTAAIAALSQFSDVITDRLAILEAAATALQAGSLSDELQHSTRQAAHKLAGSLGMFGLAEGSHLSQKIETCFQETPPTVDAEQLSDWVNQLRHDIEATLSTTSNTTPDETSPCSNEAPCRGETSTGDDGTSGGDGKCLEKPPAIIPPGAPLPLLFVVTTNPDLLRELQTSAQQTLRILQASSLSQAQDQLAQDHPSTILLDLETASETHETLMFLAHVTQTRPNASILILMREDTFESRLEIASYCSCTFLPRSAPVTQIVDSVVESYQDLAAHTFHVLVVDDDPVILQTLAKQLPPWGLRVTTLADPRQLWNQLPQLKPDLLMLDVEMPHVNGIQLCQVIRSDRTWGNLPILFLTARRDAKTVQQIFQAGADDYIAKPFAEPELVTRILNRLERQRLARRLAVIDPVTGLITEQQALRDMSRDLAIAQRYRQPYCLAVIAVNDQSRSTISPQPHLEEDVVCEIANIFSQKLRREDLVTQSDPNTFLLGLYGIHKQHAAERLRRLTQEIRADILQSFPEKNTVLSFQIGVATAPEEEESITPLRCLAEERLHLVVSSESRQPSHLPS